MHITVGRAIFILPVPTGDMGKGAFMETEREKCCCFTGHRRMSPQEDMRVRLRLRRELARMADRGIDTFLAGGAVGFDTLAAQEVLRAKGEFFPWLRLLLVLPCPGQEAKWNQRDAAVYRTLLRQADEAMYIAESYYKGCMLQRNRYLADHSAYCLCYLQDTDRGGTAYTVRYARAKGLEITNLAEADAEEWLIV